MLPRRYASACTRAGPEPASGGCTRAMTKVGEVTGPRTPSPAPMPWTRVVLPAPSGPARITRSPARSSAARRRPRSRMSPSVAMRSSAGREPGPDAGRDVIGDGAERLAPLLRGRLAVVPGAEQHHLVADRGRLVAEVDHELVHADRARDRPAAAARADQGQTRRAPRHPVRVPEGYQAEGGRAGGHVAVAV